MSTLRLFWILCFLGLSTAWAQTDQLSPRKVVQDVASGDVLLTRELHQAFWRTIREGRFVPDSELRERLSGALDLNLKFQEALFASAIASSKSRQLIQTAEFRAIDASYARRAASVVEAVVQPEYRAASLNSLTVALTILRTDARTLLEAAASGSTFSLSSGFSGTADEPTLIRLQSGIANTRKRIERLLSPEWHE